MQIIICRARAAQFKPVSIVQQSALQLQKVFCQSILSLFRNPEYQNLRIQLQSALQMALEVCLEALVINTEVFIYFYGEQYSNNFGKLGDM